ncbi:MAG: coenzyme F420-0:L-glutamate ligase [Nitrosopumilus sp.]|nr:coenzyme F420-0:L-glutamate ligase [Nitrosopumilus sp.]MDH3516082.1 coenzyme F420-0:L-glutamate ligase [Nitrosopumilus sp.]MDH3564569.1 coenzyme F420-0:L-glutamate ligase [Nitrosopumilus sp.]MDH5417497.1 coenzyme F420-0:L-glutamate ligase [Nitrosopumilus sp.]MDH5554688.1 coenzyme F420-0:L-glutamate ligase [Nitrosopumilus sp.]
MSLTVIPLLADRMESEFDVFDALLNTLDKNNTKLQEGDVIVISTKYISNSQGRIVELEKIRVSEQGMKISKKYQLKIEIAEVIVRESDKIFGGIGGFVITSSDNIIAPNAGIDKSNAKKGSVILYPNDPYLIAEQIRRKVFLKLFIHVGVILVDSRLMPARIGTSGVAVACAGIEPVLDMRAKKDLEGNPLKVTFQAVVDNLATIGNHKMGEGGESKPFAIVRNSEAKLTDKKILPSETAISPDQCVYVRGLSNPPSS